MMLITMQPEPVDFDLRVREPGVRFLHTKPHPRGSEWKRKEFWQEVIHDMYTAYGGVCAYCCEWIALTTGDPTIDHFIPKSRDARKAYEWSNFRLACLRFNRWKRDYEDVLDPFTIGDDWFQLLFPSLQVVPNPELSAEYSGKVLATIERLRLNSPKCIDSRANWLIPLAQHDISFNHLKKRAPFIARELERQGYEDRVSEIVKL